MTDNDLSLLHLVPHVLRARDFRLYTSGSRRLVDLWLNGGAAVLGHTPASLLREIKNTASRGLYAPFPHFTQQRFLKALSRLLPGRSFRIYAAPPASGLNPQLWRPFLDLYQSYNDSEAANMPEHSVPAAAQLVIPVLPGIQSWRNGLPQGLCVYAVLKEFEEEIFSKLPPDDFLPPVLLATAARGVWDLIAAKQERENQQWQRVNKILKNSQWQRRGIYLFPRNRLSYDAWGALFRQFLDAGFLLPPYQEHPLILPGILSPGEEAKLAEVLML